MIISISGTPGTGKTEVAKALSGRLGWKLIELNRLAEEKGLYSGYDKERRCKIVDIGRVKQEVMKMSKDNRNLVLESHYAHDMPCDFAVILRTTPGELRKRLMGKRWTKKKIDENIQTEIMEVCKSEALEQGHLVTEINTGGKTANAVADEIVSEMKKRGID